jgi:hypothetical protein
MGFHCPTDQPPTTPTGSEWVKLCSSLPKTLSVFFLFTIDALPISIKVYFWFLFFSFNRSSFRSLSSSKSNTDT